MKKMLESSLHEGREGPEINPNDRDQRRLCKASRMAGWCLATSLSLTLLPAFAQNVGQTTVSGDSQGTPSAGETSFDASDTNFKPVGSALDGLAESARAELERLCLPIQYRSGATAYRECVSEQLALLSDADSDSPTVSSTELSFDEQYAVQQACQSSGGLETDSYRTCTEQQLASLAGVPATPLDNLTEDEKYAVQQDCFNAQTLEGVKAYRQCLNNAVAQLLALPLPDLTSLSLIARNELQLECSSRNAGAIAYRNCLVDATGSIGNAVDSTSLDEASEA
ncbi:hypothetical protein ACUNV4_13105, partial [Granulosicoccus sp. 3-233]|uniref:hypothetical protein n=1 Tax=Granulosicoccus sp. 3-233 TaxID=3417969 RepID=UPI003D34C2C7